jgi:hypothetical protein
MSAMNGFQRKRRTREHVIADLAVNHTEKHALLAGFTVERNRHDYGIDLEINTFNRNGEIEEGKILVQLKSSDRIKAKSDRTTACRIDRRDLMYWLANPLPVILIVFDAAKDEAYWLYVQSYYRKLSAAERSALAKTATVRIPLSHVLTANAMIKFARFRDRLVRQMRDLVHDEDENQNDSV